jgi:hypothetical protein
MVAVMMAKAVGAASTGKLKENEIEYQVFKSTITPSYSVRYVNPELCDPNVTQVEIVFLANLKNSNVYCSTRVIWIWDQITNTFSGFLKANTSQKQSL